MSTTKTKAVPRKRSAARPKSAKTESIIVTISHEDLATFDKFATHFGLRREVVMESGLLGQLTTLGDFGIAGLEYVDRLPSVVDGCKVELHFVPEAAALIRFVAHISRRPLGLLTSGFLQQDAVVRASEMNEAAAGIAYYVRELNTSGQEVLKREAEAQKGRMEIDEQGLGAWEWLQLETYRDEAMAKFGSTKKRRSE